MFKSSQSETPKIELVETDGGEVTLSIDDGQAMQGWEEQLMHESADILCGYGSEFLEVGLGLGISTLRIAEHENCRKHVVVEKYKKVIDLFTERHKTLPATLQIVQADFLEYVHQLQPASVDGIFFDPYLPEDMCNDEDLWSEIVPLLVRTLRKGGALIPCFSSYPLLRWQFVPFFDRVIVERRSFSSYPETNYMANQSGNAFIQCFIKTQD